MSNPSIQELLPHVQLPSRYLGNETYRIKKEWDRTTLHIALAFPDLYEIATSHFGIQILYGILNGQEDILAERVFAPAQDMEAHLREQDARLSTLESQTPLHRFDIIGFSLLYELNYTNMANMIDLAGLEFVAKQRKDTDPILIAGGPCMCNPEPVADFFDAILVGDGEPAVLKMTEEWKVWRQKKERTKKELLLRWSKIQGVYIPSFFDVTFKTGKKEELTPIFSFYQKVHRSVASDLNDAFFPETPVIPFGKPIHDRLRIEIARGCTRGCRFCQAGMIYRPVRERDPNAVVASVHSSLEKTGYEDLSLLSLSTGDYSCIAPLMKKIMEFGQQDHIAVSLPSLRAGSLTPELMELIKKVRKTGFTIAPEAGSQRLRDVVNKNISQKDIEQTVENAFALGWKLIKLYFMVGLPTETQKDLEAIVTLVRELQKIAKRIGNGAKINVSVATFVPKPHTPFQWEPQISLETAMEKIAWLRENLKSPGIHVKWQDPKVSRIEGIWSRGDRKLGPVLIKAWEKGCRFDGWSDHFNYETWEQVFSESGIDRNDYSMGIPHADETLPWDHIDMGLKRSFLVEEREKAYAGEISDDCRTGSCGGCGVCDFKQIQPVSYHERKNSALDDCDAPIPEDVETSITYGINFSKMGEARFLGHLEMVKVFIRALRRENVPLRYSRGFHPMPKISFLDTLPVGIQSEDETMLIKVWRKIDSDRLVMGLKKQLPSGLSLNDCYRIDKKKVLDREGTRMYTVQLNDGVFDQKKLDWFRNQQDVTIEKKSKKYKRVALNLKNVVSGITMVDSATVRIALDKEKNLTIRPPQAIKAIFDVTENQLRTAIITKRKSDHV